LGIIILTPLFLILSIIILFGSGSPVLFKQWRIGKMGNPFLLLKFRTMTSTSADKSLLTVGDRDSRITPVGYFLRKYKLDELPQLINVLIGDMSFVGPRPEVSKYVELYSPEQRKVLDVKPGITDLASIEYMNESELLSKSSDPEKTYIEEIMPHKLGINLRYQANRTLLSDVKVIFKTFGGIFR
jgi:lipopolysaccharide/colanic/teichoic acid biosynthesis glycosyltransferase